jgi:glutamate synthase (NADPH/NADH) large chain
VAAGVAKTKADVILISGHDGGTGASPLNSLKHAGSPWELGLAETQQTLLANGLRDRVTVQVDGQLKTGRDVLIAALLGAEEFGFATAPLIVEGCVMMRVCHLDTCPVGIATQNPTLRARFTGQPEFVENFFLFLAEEVRELLAQLGFRSLDEAIGHVELLDVVPVIEHWKAHGLDLAPVLALPDVAPDGALHKVRDQDHGLHKALDNELLRAAEATLADGTPVRYATSVRNEHRSVGAMLGGAVTRRFGGAGLPTDTLEITLHGTAGQSFGAFLPSGVTLRIFGDTNDYVGKGLSGGRLIVRPDERASFVAEEHIIAGNTILYGATAGELFLRGRVGERFAVRNSGAIAVVEGVGDHGCEYMTGGTVVVLGATGRNFAAGMSGGTAYVWRLRPELVNRELVDLEPVARADEDELQTLVRKHFTETGSAVAERLLADWATAVEEFTVVVPREYRRVVQTIQAAEAAGHDIDAAVLAELFAPAQRSSQEAVNA